MVLLVEVVGVVINCEIFRMGCAVGRVGFWVLITLLVALVGWVNV